RFARGVAVEMHHLAGGMHAGVRAAGAGGVDAMAGDEGQRVLECRLDGAFAAAPGAVGAVEPLPAGKAGAVVFDAQGEAARAHSGSRSAGPGAEPGGGSTNTLGRRGGAGLRSASQAPTASNTSNRPPAIHQPLPDVDAGACCRADARSSWA